MDAEDVGSFMDLKFGVGAMLAAIASPTFVARPGTDEEAPDTAAMFNAVDYNYDFSVLSGQNADVLKITAPATDSDTAMITEIDGVSQIVPVDVPDGIDLPNGVAYEAITGDTGGFRLVKELVVETTTGEGDEAVVTPETFTVTVLETSAEQRVFDLSGDLDEDTGFVIRSSEGNSALGFRLSAAGDVNGDGLQDFIVGARRSENDVGEVTGKAYLIYGKADGMYGSDVTYEVRKISEYSVSFTVPETGDDPYQVADGASLVSSKVVTYSDADPAPAAGASYSFTASDADSPPRANELKLTIVEALDDVTQSVLNLDKLSATDGFNIESAFGPGAVLGSSVSSAGDINGDGFDDLLVAATGGTALDVGTPADDDAALSLGVGVGSGLVQVIYGRAAFGNVSTEDTDIAADAAMALVGTAGDNTLTGGTDTPAFYAGAGDDMIVLADGTFMRVDGGYGNDTLNFGDATFDFTDDNRTRVRSVETLALDGGMVTLDDQTVYAITEQRRASDNKAVLVVMGTGDLMLSGDWTEDSGTWTSDDGNAVVEATGVDVTEVA